VTSSVSLPSASRPDGVGADSKPNLCSLAEMTRFVYDKCAASVGAARYGRRAGSANGGGSGISEVAGEGELTVEVRRGAPRWNEAD
jgi:hypothetical protein